jgi:hypothetical protein
MEQYIILFRDRFDAARITGTRYQELEQAGIAFDGMLFGIASLQCLDSGWEPGTEFSDECFGDGSPAVDVFDRVALSGMTMRYNTFGEWHIYIACRDN